MGKAFFEGDRAGKTPRFLRPAFGKDIGDLTVGAVLQQTRKEWVAGLEQGDIFLKGSRCCGSRRAVLSSRRVAAVTRNSLASSGLAPMPSA